MSNIPGYQTIMLPILKITTDGKEHSFREIIDTLAHDYSLTDEDRKELLPSGTQAVFDNRVGWAKTYLKKAGLLSYPKRAYIQITDRGRLVIEENPEKIDAKYLKRFDEFNEFQNLSNQDNSGTENEMVEYTDKTPEEIIESVHQNMKKTLADEILDKIRKVEPSFFERLVVELLVKMGYGGSMKDAGKAIGKSGDEGIDGTIKEDKLGLDIIYIQAKRWKDGTVGRPELQKFVGALAGKGAKKGIFITTSSFTKDALEYTPKNETKIIMIDGSQLANLMIEYNLGVSIQQSYEIKKLDSDYFGDE